MSDEQGTSFSEDIERVKTAFLVNRKDILHAVQNVFTEMVRRNAQWVAKGLEIVVLALIVTTCS